MVGSSAMKLRTFVLVALLAGCGDNLAGPVVPDGPPVFAEALPPAISIPQVVSSGGPVLAAPIVQPIFFASDPDTDTQPYVEAFLPQLATSSYWSAIGTEYGVGPLTILPSIVSMDAAPVTDQALVTYLEGQLDGTHAGWPLADPVSTIYMVVLPSGLNYDGACSSFLGYHDEDATATASGFTYAVIANCGAAGAATALDEVTVTISHELIESSTDPKVESVPAYESTDAEHLAWSREAGAEVGDMCEFSQSAQQKLVGDYMVQRIWSNKSATAGHDPCVPALAGPYLNAAPTAATVGDISVTTHQGAIMTQGVTIPVGMTQEIDLKLFSDAPTTDDWGITIVDGAQLEGGTSSFSFQYDFTAAGHNGDTVRVLVTRTKTSSRGNVLFVENLVGTGDATLVPSYWWIYVQ